MIWIDFENKSPMDNDVKGWRPWTQDRWEKWLKKSEKLLTEVIQLNDAGKLVERNKFIDCNSVHWGKLKPWLLALSHGKCWFTEGRDICSHLDVEHYRPKKSCITVNGVNQDGYWWLAFEYGNFRIAGTVPNRKKGGWFPLHSASRYSTYNARCEESETPYLLDPINKSDVALLAFDEEGNAIPKPGIDTWEEQRVKMSIERLKLNDHDALPAERRRVWQQVTQVIEKYLKAKLAYRPGINPSPKETMEDALRQLYKWTREDAELSSVARWCIEFRNDPKLLNLVA